jgi:hypothetical protein
VLAVGVAGALARRERSRRAQRARRPRSKLRRQTLKQLDLAIALLEGQSAEPPERTVHETRKALKRARALVRLQREALGEKRFRRENAALRDAARRLAGTRDAEVLVDALEALVRRHPKRLGRSPGVQRLRARLLAARERAWEAMRHGAEQREQVLGELRAIRARLTAAREPAAGDDKTARAGLRRIYRQGRGRLRRARRRARDGAALHDWRKRVKDLRYAAEALKLRSLAAQADRIGEAVGEEHDLMLLAACLRAQRDCFKGDKAGRKALARAIRRRRRRLRTRAR